jgi:hypothetical protein
MSTLNVGAMAARLGLDPAEFLDKMKGVEGFTSGLNQRMSAEMKRTNKEGAESFRLIDEALGIHISRPLTKILTAEFPAFAKGLQSLIGVGVVGALAAVAFEFGEHIAKSIEKAKKAMDDYAEASRKVNDTLTNALDSWQLKIANLDRKSLASIAAEGAEEARHQIEALGKAIDDVYKKLAATESLETKVGNFFGEAFSTPQGKTTGQNQKDLDELRRKIDEAFRVDLLQGTTTAMKAIGKEIDANKTKIDALNKAMAENKADPFAHPGLLTGPEQLEGLNSQRDLLDKAQQIEQGREKFQTEKVKKVGQEEAAKQAEKVAVAINKIREAQKAVLEQSVRFGQELHQALDKNDEITRLDDAFKKTLSTLAQYRALVGGGAFFEEFGLSADQFAEQLSKVTGQLESQAQLKRFLDETKEKKGDSVTAFPIAAPRPAMPELIHGGSVAGELAAFAEEPRKQIEMMKKAFEEALSPVEKFKIAQRELDLILKNADGTFRSGAEGAAAYAGAMRHVTEEEEKALAGSRKAADGLHAFWMELQQGEASGKFAFSFATDAFKGLEDGIAKTILATRNQHHELKLMWQNYFKSLEEMAIKFALSKSFASLANLGSPNAGGGAGAVGGLAGLLAKLFGMGSGASGSAAATTAAASGGGDMGMFAGLFAEGGDVSPGSSFISGEAGAEKVNLDSRGGAHITPLGGKGGGDTHYHFDQRGAVVTEDLVRRAEAAQMIHTSSQQAVAQSVSMSQEIAKRSRPTR